MKMQGIEHRLNKISKSLSKQSVVNVYFTSVSENYWNLEQTYLAFLKHQRFDPKVIVVPNGWLGERAVASARVSSRWFAERGYETLTATDSFEGTAMPNSPSVFILTFPWSNVPSEFRIGALSSRHLVIFVPYTSQVDPVSVDYTKQKLIDTVQLSWRYCYPTAWHRDVAHAAVPGALNRALTIGYPAEDEIREALRVVAPDVPPSIIWAPHHTILPTDLQSGTFIEWHELFLDLARSREDVRLIFRPHPLLAAKLIDIWGSQRLHNYWRAWEKLRPNRVSIGPHAGAFAAASALMHDSRSFLFEWGLTRRPGAYLQPRQQALNEFGDGLVKNFTIVRSVEGIHRFIDSVTPAVSNVRDPVDTAQSRDDSPSPTFASQLVNATHAGIFGTT